MLPCPARPALLCHPHPPRPRCPAQVAKRLGLPMVGVNIPGTRAWHACLACTDASSHHAAAKQAGCSGRPAAGLHHLASLGPASAHGSTLLPSVAT